MIVEAHKGYPLVEDVNCSKKKKKSTKSPEMTEVNDVWKQEWRI